MLDFHYSRFRVQQKNNAEQYLPRFLSEEVRFMIRIFYEKSP